VESLAFPPFPPRHTFSSQRGLYPPGATPAKESLTNAEPLGKSTPAGSALRFPVSRSTSGSITIAGGCPVFWRAVSAGDGITRRTLAAGAGERDAVAELVPLAEREGVALTLRDGEASAEREPLAVQLLDATADVGADVAVPLPDGGLDSVGEGVDDEEAVDVPLCSTGGWRGSVNGECHDQAIMRGRIQNLQSVHSTWFRPRRSRSCPHQGLCQFPAR